MALTLNYSAAQCATYRIAKKSIVVIGHIDIMREIYSKLIDIIMNIFLRFKSYPTTFSSIASPFF
jgi:hypothetical protein